MASRITKTNYYVESGPLRRRWREALAAAEPWRELLLAKLTPRTRMLHGTDAQNWHGARIFWQRYWRLCGHADLSEKSAL